MAYEKLLNEIYAALSLKYLWRNYRPGFVKSESPDWVNPAMDLGMEVSQALLPADGQEECFVETYLGKLKEEIPEAALERYRGRLHFYNNRFWAILPAPEEEQDYLYKVKYRFDRKLEKLNTNYQVFSRNALYLFVHPEEKWETGEKQLFDYMKERQKDRKRKFDWVFLNCEDVIFVCDFRRNKLERIWLPQNAGDFLDSESEKLRHRSGWENGTILEQALGETEAD